MDVPARLMVDVQVLEEALEQSPVLFLVGEDGDGEILRDWIDSLTRFDKGLIGGNRIAFGGKRSLYDMPDIGGLEGGLKGCLIARQIERSRWTGAQLLESPGDLPGMVEFFGDVCC
jgi:hypothetical protein